MLRIRPGQASMTADGVALAGWWWRVLASVLDGLSGESGPEDLCLLRVELGVGQDALIA